MYVNTTHTHTASLYKALSLCSNIYHQSLQAAAYQNMLEQSPFKINMQIRKTVKRSIHGTYN